MSIEVDSIELDDLSEYLYKISNMGLWNGRLIEIEEAPDVYERVEQNLISYIFEQSLLEQEKSFEALAFIGASSEEKSLLSKDIQELRFSKDELFLPVGFKKSLKKFWKKHKKEICIGLGVVALIALAAIVTVSATAAAPVAAIAAKPRRKEEEPEEEPVSTEEEIPTSFETKAPEPTRFDPQLLFQHSLEKPSQALFSKTHPFDRIEFKEDKVLVNAREFSYPQLLDPTQKDRLVSSFYPNTPPSYFFLENPEEQAFVQDLLRKTFPEPISFQEQIKESSFEQAILPSWKTKESRAFETGGISKQTCRIGGINGVNTSLSTANDHACYIQGLTPNQNIEWVYNQTHGPADFLEVLFLNYKGYSPNTSNLLQKAWTAFHEENIDNPNAKYLAVGHSQGVAHIRNALLGLPEDIQNRIIVLAVAPAVVIPKRICFQVFNYASKKDPIPGLEVALYQHLKRLHKPIPKELQDVVERHKQLIRLEPHPDATGIDHDFQSLTFKDQIKRHIQNYLDRNGIYE